MFSGVSRTQGGGSRERGSRGVSPASGGADRAVRRCVFSGRPQGGGSESEGSSRTSPRRTERQARPHGASARTPQKGGRASSSSSSEDAPSRPARRAPGVSKAPMDRFYSDPTFSDSGSDEQTPARTSHGTLPRFSSDVTSEESIAHTSDFSRYSWEQTRTHPQARSTSRASTTRRDVQREREREASSSDSDSGSDSRSSSRKPAKGSAHEPKVSRMQEQFYLCSASDEECDIEDDATSYSAWAAPDLLAGVQRDTAVQQTRMWRRLKALDVVNIVTRPDVQKGCRNVDLTALVHDGDVEDSFSMDSSSASEAKAKAKDAPEEEKEKKGDVCEEAPALPVYPCDPYSTETRSGGGGGGGGFVAPDAVSAAIVGRDPPSYNPYAGGVGGGATPAPVADPFSAPPQNADDPYSAQSLRSEDLPTPPTVDTFGLGNPYLGGGGATPAPVAGADPFSATPHNADDPYSAQSLRSEDLRSPPTVDAFGLGNPYVGGGGATPATGTDPFSAQTPRVHSDDPYSVGAMPEAPPPTVRSDAHSAQQSPRSFNPYVGGGGGATPAPATGADPFSAQPPPVYSDDPYSVVSGGGVPGPSGRPDDVSVPAPTAAPTADRLSTHSDDPYYDVGRTPAPATPPPSHAVQSPLSETHTTTQPQTPHRPPVWSALDLTLMGLRRYATGWLASGAVAGVPECVAVLQCMQEAPMRAGQLHLPEWEGTWNSTPMQGSHAACLQHFAGALSLASELPDVVCAAGVAWVAEVLLQQGHAHFTPPCGGTVPPTLACDAVQFVRAAVTLAPPALHTIVPPIQLACDNALSSMRHRGLHPSPEAVLLFQWAEFHANKTG